SSAASDVYKRQAQYCATSCALGWRPLITRAVALSEGFFEKQLRNFLRIMAMRYHRSLGSAFDLKGQWRQRVRAVDLMSVHLWKRNVLQNLSLLLGLP
ncbi:hypothetical protein, partial [Pseudomonas sp. 10S4]|uniref:hypothetical protein n=1 Tax=Pseudomonas sp. 10S4 TaxID=3048583 RepID=UPI002B236D36